MKQTQQRAQLCEDAAQETDCIEKHPAWGSSHYTANWEQAESQYGNTGEEINNSRRFMGLGALTCSDDGDVYRWPMLSSRLFQ